MHKSSKTKILNYDYLSLNGGLTDDFFFFSRSIFSNFSIISIYYYCHQQKSLKPFKSCLSNENKWLLWAGNF